MGDEDEFLEEASGEVDGGLDGEVLEEETDAALGGGIVGLGDGGGDEIAANAGVVELGAAVVALGEDERGHGVKGARFCGAGALVIVARVLVEDGGEDGSGEHDVGEIVGVAGAEAFGVAFHAAAIAGSAVGLIDTGGESDTSDGDGVNNGAQRELELESGSERERDGERRRQRNWE